MAPNDSLTTVATILTLDDAGALAFQVLGFLAEDKDRLIRFFDLTGMSPQDLHSETKNQAFQAAILDYLMQDESLLMVFCAHAGINPALIPTAKNILDPLGENMP